jgi:hypothetical protein
MLLADRPGEWVQCGCRGSEVVDGRSGHSPKSDVFDRQSVQIKSNVGWMQVSNGEMTGAMVGDDWRLIYL